MRRHDRRLPFRLFAALLFVGAVALVLKWPELAVLQELRQAHGKGPRLISPQSPREFPDRSARPVYAYSVVPGGVTDAEDARRAVATDPVVGAHYRGLDLGRLSTTTLNSEKLAYVSFRKGDQVFWTTKRVRLPKGETVLTDGANMVRARCGNRISDASMALTTPQEPPPAELDTPLLPGGPMAPIQTPAPPEQARLLALGTPVQLPEPPPPLPETPEEMITSAPTDGALSALEQNGFPGFYWTGFPSPGFFPGWGSGPVSTPLLPPAKPSDHGGAGSQDSGGSSITAVNSSDQPADDNTPEPSSWLLVGGGMLGFGLLTRARRGRNR